MNSIATKGDLYSRITSDIVRHLENGVRSWHQPWKPKHASGGISRPLRHNSQPCHGINVLILWLSAFERQFTSPLWVTFQQSKEMGAHIRKGEKATTTVYANAVEKTEIDESTGEEVSQRIPFLRSYSVFNAEQIEGLPEWYYAKVVNPQPLEKRIETAEAFFAKTKAEIQHGGSRACYSPTPDIIRMPRFESFESPESYYSTLAHESIDWTKPEPRLNRSFNAKRFGDDGYAMEELVAEIGAAFLCSDLGITPEVMPEHASYLNDRLSVLKADSKAIFTAAAYAEKAAGYLHALQES